jgi:hypothetical protein
MSLRATFICLLTLVLFAKGAYSSEIYVEERKRALLILEGYSHWASFTYDFFNNVGVGATTSHFFKEKYNVSTNFSILDIDILNLQLSGDVGLSQFNTYSDRGSASSGGFNYDYLLSGTAFQRSWHPINFRSGHSTDDLSDPYSGTQYTTDTTDNDVEVALLKGPIRTRASYRNNQRSFTSTNGTSDVTTDTFTFKGNHNYKASATSLDATFGRARGTTTRTDGYQLALTNSLTVRDNSLTSSASTTSADDQGIVSRNISWQEDLSMRPGRALAAYLGYRYSNDQTTSFSGAEQTTSSNTVIATLTHELFQSLYTTLNGSATYSNILGGEQTLYTGLLMLRYYKNISEGSRLTLGLTKTYSLTERNLATSQLSVRDEQHVVALQGITITLGSTGTLAQVVSVTSKNPDVTYVEGRDYTVDPILRTITIVPGGTISPGTVIFISYILNIDPSVKFSVDGSGASGSLSWGLGRYAMSGFISTSHPSVISGTSQSLVSTRQDQLRFDARFPNYSFGLEGGEYVSGDSESQYLYGVGNYTKLFLYSQLSLQLSDRYTWYGATPAITGYGQNSLSTLATYLRTFPWGQCSLAGNYITNSGPHVATRDFFYVKGVLTARYNKLTFNLNGQTAFRYTTGTHTRNDTVHLEIIREF